MEICALFRSSGLTRQEIASRAGLSYDTIRSYGQGRRTPPPETISRLESICHQASLELLERAGITVAQVAQAEPRNDHVIKNISIARPSAKAVEPAAHAARYSNEFLNTETSNGRTRPAFPPIPVNCQGWPTAHLPAANFTLINGSRCQPYQARPTQDLRPWIDGFGMARKAASVERMGEGTDAQRAAKARARWAIAGKQNGRLA